MKKIIVRSILALVAILVLGVLGLAVRVGQGIHNYYYRYGDNYNLGMASDASGIYQISYALSGSPLHTYGRAAPCGPPGSNVQGIVPCIAVRKIRCVSAARLRAERQWPLSQVGDLPVAVPRAVPPSGANVPLTIQTTSPRKQATLLRPPQKAVPPFLLVQYGSCYREFPLLR